MGILIIDKRKGVDVMENDVQTKQTYSEIDEFLELLDEKKRNEVPTKLREFFKKEKDNNYHKGIDPNISIKEQNLKKETLALIALLNLQYWCKDEKEKERLKQVYASNENRYQEELREKYNPNNIFKNVNTEKVKEEVALVEVKEDKWYKKLFNFFRKIIRK